ncbi:MAG: HAD-IB family phosphatase [Haloferacaceae archaeon]
MTVVAFDFDGTLSRTDVSVLLGREHDVESEVRGLIERGYRGDLDFERSLRQRVALLEGMREEDVEEAFQRCKLREDAAEMIAELRRSGASVAIVTGSFGRGVEAALDRAGVAVDHLAANRLVLEDGAVTGEVEGPLVGGDKERAFREIVAAASVSHGETVAVGDGLLDLPMLRAAGTAIGFNPVPLVEENVDAVVTSVRKLRLYFQQNGIVEADGPVGG